jgi:outer membrane protein assembly factor BamB
VGSLFVLNRPDKPDANTNLAFQPSAELPDDVNNGGDPGGSWVLGETNPEMTFAVEMGSLTGDLVGYDPTRIRGIVVGDSFIFPTFSNGRGFLHRSDLGGESLVWSVPLQALSNIVSDSTYIYVVTTTGVLGTSPAMLTAISLETGATVWQLAGIESSIEATTSLVIAGDMLYVANTAGDTMAVSAREGIVRWMATPHAAGASSVDILARTPAAPFMVLGDAGLFVVRSDQSVVRLDPATGDETRSIDVPGTVGSSAIMTIPQVRDNTLALLVAHL